MTTIGEILINVAFCGAACCSALVATLVVVRNGIFEAERFTVHLSTNVSRRRRISSTSASVRKPEELGVSSTRHSIDMNAGCQPSQTCYCGLSGRLLEITMNK